MDSDYFYKDDIISDLKSYLLLIYCGLITNEGTILCGGVNASQWQKILYLRATSRKILPDYVCKLSEKIKFQIRKL